MCADLPVPTTEPSSMQLRLVKLGRCRGLVKAGVCGTGGEKLGMDRAMGGLAQVGG